MSEVAEENIRYVRTQMVQHLTGVLGRSLTVEERHAIADFIGHKRSGEPSENPLHFWFTDPDRHEWDNIMARMQALTGPYGYALFKAAVAKANIAADGV